MCYAGAQIVRGLEEYPAPRSRSSPDALQQPCDCIISVGQEDADKKQQVILRLLAICIITRSVQYPFQLAATARKTQVGHRSAEAHLHITCNSQSCLSSLQLYIYSLLLQNYVQNYRALQQ